MKICFSRPYSANKSLYIYGSEKDKDGFIYEPLRFGCGVGYTGWDNKMQFHISFGFFKDCTGGRKATKSYHFKMPFTGPAWLHRIIDNRYAPRKPLKNTQQA